jgi:aspartate kinase
VARTIHEKHEEAARALLADEFSSVMADIDQLIEDYTRFCASMHVLGEATPRALDYTMGLGERMSARLVAAALRKMGLQAEAVDATRLIVTDAAFQNATPLMEQTRANINQILLPMLESGIVPIVTGFISATVDGISTTLGRGGSDYSAALIGACLESDEVWIWTDVDGVMSTDPRTVPEARILDVLTYHEISELAYFGAKVLHPKTIRPVLDAGIPLRVKNTFNASHPGTLIVANGEPSKNPIKAVTAFKAMSLVNVEGKGMLGIPGIAARTFGTVAFTGTSIMLISQASSEQSICFVIPQSNAPKVVDALNKEFARELTRRDIDCVTTLDNVTVITVVGAGMLYTPGVAGKVFTATGEAGVNVIAITQGSSESSISLVVSDRDADAALRAIHPLTLVD